MHELTFFVPGPPVPKARARTVVAASGKMMSFTPERTRQYERLVKDCAALAVRQAKWELRTTPVALHVIVCRARRSGDATNFCKSIEDACNGVVWTDDDLVRDIRIIVLDDGTPGVTVRVRDLEEP